MRVAIHQPNYLPWLGYFYKMQQADVFILLDHVQYSKNSYQNRVQVKGPNGVQWLTAPVSLRKGAFQPTSEIEFADQKWKQKHIKTIEANYGRCDFFETYAHELFDLLSSSENRMSCFNERLILWLRDKLGISSKIVRSSELEVQGEASEMLINLVQKVGGTEYLCGQGAQKYQEDDLFEKAGLSLKYSDFKTKAYAQRWGDFVSGMSAIDFLFNEGFEAVAAHLMRH